MGAGDSIFVGETIKAMGVPGAIIIVLMMVIGILSGVIVYMYKQANKVYGYRLAERDVLNSALTSSTAQLKEALEEQKDQNELIEELAGLISKQGTAFETLTERVRLQYEGLKEDNTRMNLVVSSIADAMRQAVALQTEIRNTVQTMSNTIQNLVTGLPQMVTEMRSIIQNWNPTRGRRKL